MTLKEFRAVLAEVMYLIHRLDWKIFSVKVVLVKKGQYIKVGGK